MSVHRYVHETADSTAAACAAHIESCLETSLRGHGIATFAISGGSSPKILFEHLVKARIDWERVHIFWVDERVVDPTHEQSNFGMADRALITPAGIPHRNVHRVMGELRPDAAAEQYVADIVEFFGLEEGTLPQFDLIHRGLGTDCHTASLFPGEPLIEDRDNIAAAVYVEKLAQWRVTLLPGVLLAARHSVVFSPGADKAEAIQTVIEGRYDPMRFPAQLTSHHGRSVSWFLDAPAARLLT
jgi:6-phosphogluconolactonase